MKSQVIQQGAEAIIYLDNNQIIKDRIKKSYRISVLDEKLRKTRTKSEAKIMNKLQRIIPVPKILKTDEKEKIIMEYIPGEKLSNNLEKLNYKEVCKKIAENLSKLHDQNIIHGDLTTSNMIYVDKNNDMKPLFPLAQNDRTDKNLNINNEKSARLLSKRKQSSINNQSNKKEIANYDFKIYFIDFGLAFHSHKIEDKAVDLHLLQQALEAKHFTIWQECWKIILDNYEADKHKEIIQRIKTIESRGRYKDKY